MGDEPTVPVADEAPTPKRSARLIGLLEQAAQLLREGHQIQIVCALQIDGDVPRAAVHVEDHQDAHELVWQLLHAVQRLEPHGPISEVSEVTDDA